VSVDAWLQRWYDRGRGGPVRAGPARI